VNFLMDGAVLLTTAWARKTRVTWWRAAVSAGIGASYVILMFFPELHFLFTFVVKSIFSVVMIMTAFGFGSLQNFVRNLGMFYFVNFAFAGGLYGFEYLLQSSGDVMNGIWFTHTGMGGTLFTFRIGPLFLVVASLAVIFSFRRIMTFTRQKEQMTHFLAKVQVQIGEFVSTCTGLIDTGNQLYDPLTRTPVMVMEAAQWRDRLPDSWMKRIQRAEVEQIVTAIGTEEFVWQDRLRLVPFRGVGRGTQFMLAIKPDKVVITRGDQTKEIAKVLIGLDGGKLCHDESYQAIIHPALMAN
jgi:stage II sporulation protein GA (sporulation sigma-E factor processing peptidase)